MAKPDRVIFPDPEAMSLEAAKRFVQTASEAITERDRFLAVLSGGRTSRRTYELLASTPFRDEINWSKVHLFVSDERFVPMESSESNFGLIQRLLLSKISIPKTNLHPFCVEANTLEEAARETAEAFWLFFGKTRRTFPRFDLVFLGMGADGHVAGIFPGTEAFRERGKWVVFSKNAGGFNRLSLTLPFLNAARKIIVLVAGEEKAERTAHVLEGNATDLPAGALQAHDGQLSWFLDQAAASLLEKERR